MNHGMLSTLVMESRLLLEGLKISRRLPISTATDMDAMKPEKRPTPWNPPVASAPEEPPSLETPSTWLPSTKGLTTMFKASMTTAFDTDPTVTKASMMVDMLLRVTAGRNYLSERSDFLFVDLFLR